MDGNELGFGWELTFRIASVVVPVAVVWLVYIFNSRMFIKQRSFDLEKERAAERKRHLSEIIVSMRRLKELAFRAQEDQAGMRMTIEGVLADLREQSRRMDDEELKAYKITRSEEMSEVRRIYFESRKRMETEIETACIAAELYDELPKHVQSAERHLGVLVDEYGKRLVKVLRRPNAEHPDIQVLATEPIQFIRLLQKAEDEMLAARPREPQPKSLGGVVPLETMPSLRNAEGPQALP